MMEPVAWASPNGRLNNIVSHKRNGTFTEPLVRLSDAEARIAELERERDEATGTLRYCEQQWAEERGTMIDKFVFERARAEAAEALLKEAMRAMDRCEHDGGFDREIGPIGCSLGDKCVCIGVYPIIARAIHDKIGVKDE